MEEKAKNSLSNTQNYWLLFLWACLMHFIFASTLGYSPGMELAIIPVFIFNVFMNFLLPAMYSPLSKQYSPKKSFLITFLVIALVNFGYIFRGSSRGQSLIPDIEYAPLNGLRTTFYIEPIDADSTDLANTTVTLTRFDKLIDKQTDVGKLYPYFLDFNSFYLIRFSKPGFETKIIYFNTTIPEGREKLGFPPFQGIIKLHKGNPTIEKASGGIKYDPISSNFQKVEKI